MRKKIPPYLRLVFKAEPEDPFTFKLTFGDQEITLRSDPEELAREAERNKNVVRLPWRPPEPEPLKPEVIKRICEESGLLIPGADAWVYEAYMTRWKWWGHPDDLAREIRRKHPLLFPLQKAQFGIRNKKTIIGSGYLELLTEEGLKNPVESSKKLAWLILRGEDERR